VWDELRERVALERRQIHRLFRLHGALLEKCAASAPDGIELSALAAMLHSFYNGMENIFKPLPWSLATLCPAASHGTRNCRIA